MVVKRVRVKPTKTVVLDFEDGDYEGARVVCAAGISMGVYREFTRTIDEDEDTMIHNIAILERFGREILVEWNLDDNEGKPIPATADGMLTIPLELAGAIFQRWNEALVTAPAPLDEPSPSADVLPAQSIPMETLSGSPENSPGLSSSSDFANDLVASPASY